jgi:hypothetical protein
VIDHLQSASRAENFTAKPIRFPVPTVTTALRATQPNPQAADPPIPPTPRSAAVDGRDGQPPTLETISAERFHRRWLVSAFHPAQSLTEGALP